MVLEKVGYQGIEGSYSEEALMLHFNNKVYEKNNYSKFEDVFIAIDKGEVHSGVLPIENSSTGAIAEVYDLLNKYDCKIVGEQYVKVSHSLLGTQEATIETIEEVYSHPQGFEQSKEFLSAYDHWRCIPYYNTARSARLVKKENSPVKAAIGSMRAAELYGLKVLKEGINCHGRNTTRFIIVKKEQIYEENQNKISVILSTKHEAGALFSVLRHLADEGINMVKIESRPLVEEPWEYLFYIDFEGNLLDNKIRSTMKRMEETSCYLKLLGNYKKGDRPWQK